MKKIFKVRSGNARTAIILFESLVLKVPNLRFEQAYRLILKNSEEKFLSLKKIRAVLGHLYFYLLHGIIANATEGLLYQKCFDTVSGKGSGKPKFLTPTFSLGFVNFQPYYGEKQPTRQEILDVYNSLPDRYTLLLKGCDAHDYLEENWRITKDGLKLIDFGLRLDKNEWAFFLERMEFYEATKDRVL